MTTVLLQKLKEKSFRSPVVLGEKFKIKTGGTPSRTRPDFYIGGTIPWVKTQELTDKRIYNTSEKITLEAVTKSNAKVFPAGSVLLAMYGATVGKLGRLGIPAATNQACAAFIPNENSNQDYLYYLLLKNRRKIISEAVGAAQQNLSLDKIRSFEFEFPDLETQKKIAEILSAYDEKIENNNSIIKNLEAMAQIIFDEWFIKLRFPDYGKTKFIKSEIGLIPEGWQMQRLGDVVDLAYGKALSSENREVGPYPVLGSSGIVGFHKNALVPGPGIVVGRKGNVGSITWVEQDFYPIDTTFFVVSKLDLHFCFFMLKRQAFHSGDSAVPGLNREAAYSNSVLIPPKKLQEQYGRIVKKMFAQISDEQKENHQLGTIRNLLLAKFI